MKKKEVNKESFFYKYKNDKKYNAKVQLTGFCILIGFVIIWGNISNISNNNSNSITENRVNNYDEAKEQTEVSLLEKINTNYNYDITINLTKTNDEIINYNYKGKSYNNTLEINKDNIVYYKVDDYYYKLQENNYILATTEEIYNIVPANYIELNEVLEYISKASLDHITNYSSGKKESLYNLYLKDILINNKTEDIVTINVTEENEILNIKIDYTNLLKVMNQETKECIITYNYTNIDKVEEFHITEVEEGENNE